MGEADLCAEASLLERARGDGILYSYLFLHAPYVCLVLGGYGQTKE